MAMKVFISFAMSILVLAPCSSLTLAQKSGSEREKRYSHPPPPPPPPVPGSIPFPVLPCPVLPDGTILSGAHDQRPIFKEEYSQYIILSIPPQQCWTTWLIRPKEAKTIHIYTESTGLLHNERYISKEAEQSMLQLVPKNAIGFLEDLEAIRFKNSTNDPAVVIISLYRVTGRVGR